MADIALDERPIEPAKASASRPDLDKGFNPLTAIIFFGIMAAGLLFVGYSLVRRRPNKAATTRVVAAFDLADIGYTYRSSRCMSWITMPPPSGGICSQSRRLSVRRVSSSRSASARAWTSPRTRGPWRVLHRPSADISSAGS
jgi:hypothetical protein